MDRIDPQDRSIPDITYEQLRHDWLTKHLLNAKGLSPRTARSYDFAGKHLERFFGKTLSEIDDYDMDVFFEEATISQRYKGVCLSAIKSFQKYECRKLRKPPTPLLTMSSPRVPNRQVPAVTVEQALCILEHAETPLDKRLVYCGLFAGTRISEACDRIDANDPNDLGIYEWREDRITLQGKGRKPREIPLHSELAAVMDEIRSVTCPDRRALEYRVQRLKMLCGFDWHSHMLRGRFARSMEELEEKGVEHRTVQSLMGHVGDITDTYTGGVPFSRKSKAMNLYALPPLP